MKVAVIVLNWNGEKYLSKCLTALEKLNKGKNTVEIVVVDNASVDQSVSLVKSSFPKFTLLQSEANLGYAAGNNLGLQYALDHGYDWAWIVNPDIEVDVQALVNLLTEVAQDSTIGAAGSKVYFAPGFEFHKARYTKQDLGKVLWFAGGHMDWANSISVHDGIDEVDRGQYDRPHAVDFLTGSSMLLSVPALKQVGLLDPKYFLYFEETDLCQRLVQAKYKLVYIPTSVVWHANAQATGAGSGLVDYFTTRNRLLFGWRWAPIKTKIALLRQSLSLLLAGRPWQKKGVLDFYLGRFGKGSYA